MKQRSRLRYFEPRRFDCERARVHFSKNWIARDKESIEQKVPNTITAVDLGAPGEMVLTRCVMCLQGPAGPPGKAGAEVCGKFTMQKLHVHVDFQTCCSRLLLCSSCITNTSVCTARSLKSSLVFFRALVDPKVFLDLLDHQEER